MIILFRHAGILLSAILASLILAANGQTLLLIVCLFSGGLWLLNRNLAPRNPYRLGSVCFLLLCTAAGLGFLGGAGADGLFSEGTKLLSSLSAAARGIVLTGSVFFALAGWDLDRVLLLLEGTAQTEGKLLLVQRHIRRLASVLLTGVGLVAAAVLISLKAGFWMVLALVLLTFVGTGALIRGLRREPEMMPANRKDNENE